MSQAKFAMNTNHLKERKHRLTLITNTLSKIVKANNPIFVIGSVEVGFTTVPNAGVYMQKPKDFTQSVVRNVTLINTPTCNDLSLFHQAAITKAPRNRVPVCCIVRR